MLLDPLQKFQVWILQGEPDHPQGNSTGFTCIRHSAPNAAGSSDHQMLGGGSDEGIGEDSHTSRNSATPAALP